MVLKVLQRQFRDFQRVSSTIGQSWIVVMQLMKVC